MGALHAALTLLALLRCAWVELCAAAADAAARVAAAAPIARPLLSLAFRLGAVEHSGSQPRPPRCVGLVVGEALGGEAAAAAATAAAADVVAW